MYSVLTQTVVVATSNSSPMAGYTLCAAICTALLSRQVVVDFWAGKGSAIGSTCGCEWEGENKVYIIVARIGRAVLCRSCKQEIEKRCSIEAGYW